MKKLFIVLAALGIFQIGSSLYLETKQLEEPILIASVVDLDSNRIYVSYITNRLNPSELQSIAIEDVQYYPNPNEFNMFNSDQKVVETFADYRYYSIISPYIPLYTDQLEAIKQQLIHTKEATVYFKDGHSEQVTLDIQEVKGTPQLEFVLSSGGSQGSELAFKAVEPITIREVELVKGDVEITYFAVKGKEIELPLQAPVELGENEQIHLKATDILSRFPGDKFIIHLHVTDKNGVSLVLPLTNNINGTPSEQWVEQMIEEREKR